MANTRIVCPINSDISSRARLDIIDLWLAYQALELENQGRFPGGLLLQIVWVFFFTFFVL